MYWVCVARVWGWRVLRVAVMEQLWWHLEPIWGHPTTAAAEDGLEGQFPALLCPQHHLILPPISHRYCASF